MRREAGDWRLGAGDWRLEAGGWGLEAGGWRLETGDWRLEVGAVDGSYREVVVTALRDKAGGRAFLEVFDEKTRLGAFGGNQAWFRAGHGKADSRRSDYGSCGVIAAANILAYMDKCGHNGICRCAFLPKDSYLENGAIKHGCYMKLANELYDNYVTPFDTNKIHLVNFNGVKLTADSIIKKILAALRLVGKIDESRRNALANYYSLGIWPISRVEKGIKRFAADRRIRLVSYGTSNNDLQKAMSFERGCTFVKNALKENCPVMILLSHNPSARHKGCSSDRHYMVITEIEEIFEITDIKSGERLISREKRLVDANIVVASWGGESSINFKSIWMDSIFYDISAFLGKNIVTRSLGAWMHKNMNSVYLTVFK